MNKPKPFVGQTLYSLNVGNAARNCAQVLTPLTVIKVGRKYFTCAEGNLSGQEYHLSDWRERTNYSACSELFESQQAWEDSREAHDIEGFLSGFFRYGNTRLPLESLRRIKAISQGVTP